MSDRIAVFNQGRIEQIGPPGEIYERPVTPFVANFVGENSRIDGHVEQCTAARCTVATAGGMVLVGEPAREYSRGHQVELSIRPEAIHIEPSEPSLDNCVSARVLDTTYFGDYVMVGLAIADGVLVSAKVAAGAFRERKLERDAQVMIGWRASHCRVLG